jgi:hypothetical protein
MATHTPEWLAQRLDSERQKTVVFFSDLTSHQAEQEVYLEGSTWRVREVLAHLVASEAAHVRLIRNVVSGGAGAPEDFNIDRFNESQLAPLRAVPLAELLRRFDDLRRQTVRLVASFTLEDLEKQGRQPFLGMTTVEEMIQLIYRHVQIHLRDIRRVLGMM